MKYFATLAFWITLILYIHCAYGKLVVVSISIPQAPVENDLDTSKDVATSRIDRLRKNQKIFEQTMNTDGFEGIELFHKNFESISAYAFESGRVLADHINGKATAEELQEARKIMDIITRAQERSRKKYAEQERETERRERERQQTLERERVLEQNRRQEEENSLWSRILRGLGAFFSGGSSSNRRYYYRSSSSRSSSKGRGKHG